MVKPPPRSRRGPARSSAGGSRTLRAWEKLRAASGLAVLVVVAGVGLAAIIGGAALAVGYALRQAVGG